MLVDGKLKRPALSININDHANEQAEMVLFVGHMYTHLKGIKQADDQENEREARSPQVVNVWSLDLIFRNNRVGINGSKCIIFSSLCRLQLFAYWFLWKQQLHGAFSHCLDKKTTVVPVIFYRFTLMEIKPWQMVHPQISRQLVSNQ